MCNGSKHDENGEINLYDLPAKQILPVLDVGILALTSPGPVLRRQHSARPDADHLKQPTNIIAINGYYLCIICRHFLAYK